MALRIVIDDRLETARLAYPIEAGWVTPEGVERVPGLTREGVADADIALVDSLTALSLLSDYAIVAGLAVVAREATMLTLATHTRPDDVDDVVVSHGGVSQTGMAVAIATVQPFYGIAAREWTTESHDVDERHAVVSEGPGALIPIERDDVYQEDLGRAWFLMTTTPFVSHVSIARRSLLVRDPASVAAAVGELRAVLDVATERGRELRRDLAKRHGIDRDLLVEVLANQEWELTDEGSAGLTMLARMAGSRWTSGLSDSIVHLRPPARG